MVYYIIFKLMTLIGVQKHVSSFEFKQIIYFLESVYINLEKCFEIYLLAIFLKSFLLTLTIHICYTIVRFFSGGWHAKRSFYCSLFGVFSFNLFPFFLHKLPIYKVSNWTIILIGIVSISLIITYSPADTEKNPRVNPRGRKTDKLLASIAGIMILVVSILFFDKEIRLLAFTGMLLQSVLITPLFYKIMRRSYKNYEKYE